MARDVEGRLRLLERGRRPKSVTMTHEQAIARLREIPGCEDLSATAAEAHARGYPEGVAGHLASLLETDIRQLRAELMARMGGEV